jgi:hypothetical protein
MSLLDASTWAEVQRWSRRLTVLGRTQKGSKISRERPKMEGKAGESGTVDARLNMFSLPCLDMFDLASGLTFAASA